MHRERLTSRTIMSETHEHITSCATASATHFFAEKLLSDQPHVEVTAFKKTIKKDHKKYKRNHTKDCLFRNKSKRVYSVNLYNYASRNARPAMSIK